MRIELLEKLVLALATLAVLAVGGLVVTLSILPLRSGIPKVAVESSLATQDWLGRLRNGGRPAGPAELMRFDTPLPPPKPAADQPPPTPGQPAPPPTATASASTGYFEASGNIPPAEQVPGFPWLRRMPGVAYTQPQQVPDILYKRYQSFDETWTLVQEGGGEFTTTGKGETAYQVNWVDENSYLYSRLGLRRGDKVISVNGQPIGTSLTAGKALYEQLKGERRFAVMIERQGQPLVLSFYVGQ